MGGRRRSDYCEITNEHRAFKQLLEEKKVKDRRFSYRLAGLKLGKSNAYISHLANGRAYFPEGDELELILERLFGIKVKSFKERVRTFHHKKTPTDELKELAEKLSPEKTSIALKLIRSI